MNVPSISLETTAISNVTESSIENTSYRYSGYLIAAYYSLVIRSYVTLSIGLTGSVLTLIVMSRASLPPNGMAQYLSTIAICDAVHLVINAIFITVIITQSSLNKWFCRLCHFIYYSSTFTSDIVVMMVALNRVIAVMVPHKAKLWCTPGKARRNILIVVFIEMMISLQTLWTWGATESVKECIRDYRYITVIKVFGLLVLCQNILGIIILSVCSGVIIYKLKQQRHLMAKMQMNTSQAHASRNDGQIGVMLVSVSILFLLTNAPLIFIHTSSSMFGWARFDAFHTMLYTVLIEVGNSLKSFNHTLNFFVYVLSAQFFRKEVAKMFGCATQDNG